MMKWMMTSLAQHTASMVLLKIGLARARSSFHWVFALYFPQDTPLELGGTEILRNCHFLPGIVRRGR